MPAATKKARRGTANKGQEYEILLPALYALKFFEDPSIKNFVLRTNIDDFECWDDLLVTLHKSNGENENYAFQLKHKEKPRLQLKCLESESKSSDFGVLKYCEGFHKISQRDSYHFIIYTNAYFVSEVDDKIPKFDIIRNGDCPGKAYFFLPSAKSDKNAADIYNFRINKNTKTTVTATDAVYRSFFKKFALYTYQKNWQEIQEMVVETFKQIFHTTDNSVAMAYVDIFKVWKLHEYSTVEIKRDDLKVKILDLILSPHILTPTEQNDASQNFARLQKAFLKFDYIVISGLDDSFIAKFLWNPHFEEDEDFIHLAKNLKLLTKFVNAGNISHKQEIEIKQKIGYFRKETPIVIKILEANADTIATTLAKLKKVGDKLHFVFTGEAHLVKTKFTGFKVFETLHDLCAEDDYQEITESLRIFLNGKEYCFQELFANSSESKINVTTKNIIEMLTGNFQIDVIDEKVQDPYIPRWLSVAVIKIESIDEIDKDIVVISHKGGSKMMDSLKNVSKKEFVEASEYLQEKVCSKDVVIYQDTLEKESLFEKICQMNPTRNVHHFSVYDEEFLQWISSEGNITEVKKCEVSTNRFLHESEIYEKFQNRINVIVASPGMGKSEILKKLKITCPSDFFPILINLKEHDAFLKDRHEDEEVLDYFIRSPNEIFFLLEIKRNFAKSKNIIFFLDGLDELKTENIGASLQQIKQLSETGCRIWLSSRSHLKETIEDYFNLFTIDLRSFNDNEQRDYINGRLKNNENVETLSTEIFKNIDTILENRDILDLPLQLFMITEILTDFSSEVISNMFVLTHMFQYFLIGRYRHFFNKCKCGHWELLSKIVNDSKKYRLIQYQIAALKSCLNKDEFESLNLRLDETFVDHIRADGDFLGIILKITCSTVIFHHDITATYFAALWFAENFVNLQEFLKTLLFKEEYVHLRLMFDMILAEKFPAHVATLYRNVKALDKYKNEVYKVDTGGRSPLHLACSHGCRSSILKNIQRERVNVVYIKNMRKANEESRKVLNVLLEEGLDLFELDEVFGWNCFDFCDKTVFLLPLEIILEQKNCQKFEKALSAISELDLVKNHKWTVLYYSAVFSYAKLFQNFFDNTDLEAEQITILLEVATMWNSWKIINILLDYNNDNIHTKTKNGRTILHLASSMGHVELVVLLLFKEADVNATDQFGRTPLHLAALNGHIVVVKKLLESGAEVDVFDNYGRTPLHLAVEKGNEELVKFLIDERGAQVNKTAWNGWGSLQLAIMEGHVNMVKLLLERNGNFEKIDGYGTKPVHIAAKRANIEILEILLTNSKNVDVVASDGRTSLHFAAESGNVAGIEYLLKKQANINAFDQSGKRVLHWAVIAKQAEVVELLLKHNVDVDVVDHHGRNCLQWAAEGGSLRIVKLLLGKMTKLVNEQAKNGSTALHWAANNGHTDIVTLLVTAGANINAKDVQGRTPLCWAALEGHTKIVELLLSKNAHNVDISGKPALEFVKLKKNHIRSQPTE